jgi:indolepyruvate ferredoxin oxidoreductase
MAASPGSAGIRSDLETKYTAESGRVFLSGTQALVRVVVDAVRRDRLNRGSAAAFVSGYPGSPLGGLDREMARNKELLKGLGIVHAPGLNEELAATAVAGSQLVQGFRSRRAEGVLGVWYGKSPGVDRALDAIRHGQFTGASSKGGVLLLVGDDPECKSSTLPSASEHTLISADAPVLYPGTIQDIIDLGAHAVSMSRASGLWTAMKLVSSVADSIGTAELRPAVETTTPIIFPNGNGPIVRLPSVPQSLDAEREIVEIRLQAARAYGARAELNQVTVNPSDAWIGVVAAGPLYSETVEALRLLGLEQATLQRYGVRLMRVRMLFPLEPSEIRRYAAGLQEIVVVEEKRPLLESFFREVLYGAVDAPVIVGRSDEKNRPLLPGYGTIRARELAQILASRLSQRVPSHALRTNVRARTSVPLVAVERKPFFCSGCPHNTSARVPPGALVGSGIGCHAIVEWSDPAMVGEIVTKAQMGGEGTSWIGIEPFVEDTHIFQNIGDGTYFHSGQLAVQAAVAAGSHITFKLLYNSAIAMTGGQSISASNGRPVSDVAAVLLHQGVRRVLVTTEDLRRYRKIQMPKGVDVWPRARIVEAQEILARTPGVTVLIHDQECAAEKRRGRKRGRLAEPGERVVINERVCEGCGDCGVKSNCLSLEPVETEFGRKTRINQTSCNMDYSCIKGNCPSFVTIKAISPRSRRLKGRDRHIAGGGQGSDDAHEQDQLETPELIVNPDDFTVRMPGIGGTGVVTVSQIIGTAASYAGRYVSGLDQTGLSQKAGPVVSDVRFSTRPINGSNRADAGGVDLYLGFDEIVALSPRNVETIVAGQTVCVLSSSRSPTGDMISHVDKELPDEDHIGSLFSGMVPVDRLFRVDAQAETARLLGSSTCANIFLLGIAFQAGALPLPIAAIENAITLNGVAIADNTAAFRAGRLWIIEQKHAPVTSGTAECTSAQHGSGPRMPRLGKVLETRIADLEDYQDQEYARHYVSVVELAGLAEERAVPERQEFSRSVAIYLHKIMAYKDEYEVARLHLKAAPKEAQDPGVRMAWNLEPPILKALGYDRKIRVGRWFGQVFKLLRAARRIRGSWVDPFGHTQIRRAERRLAEEYESDIRAVAAILSPETYDLACEFARLPDVVRGYEEVKLNNLARYEAGRIRLLRQLLGDVPERRAC